MQPRKSPLAVAAFALFSALPLAAQAQSTPAPSSGSLDVWFKAPLKGSTVKGLLTGPNCYVNGSGPIARVQFRLDGAAVNTDSAPADGMQCSLDTTKFANGSHQLRADAYDSAGNRRTDIIAINVQNVATNAPPAVSMTAPAASQTVSGSAGYSANAIDDAGVARVDFFLDGGTTALLSDAAAPYGGTLDTTKIANGTHTLMATAYDAQGLKTSAQVSFNVSNTTATGSTSAPYTGTPVALPATMQAVNFDKGGEGVAYHDLSTGNLGALYRTSEAVDIYASTDTASSPYQIANFQTGEWMKYTVKVAANGNYDLGIRAANNAGTGAFHIEVDGANVTGPVSVPSTGSWTSFQWFGKKGVALSAGTHVVRLVADQQWFNVSALSMLASGTTSTGTTSGSTSTSGSTTTKPSNMLFWSGFEGPLSLTTPSDCYANGCFQQLVGADSGTGYSWPFSLKGGTTQFQLLANSTSYPSSGTIGTWMHNELQSVVGHKGNQTKALYQEIRQSGCCGTDSQGGGSTQNPMLVQPGSEPGDIYMSKWIKLQPDLLDKLRAGDAWRTIFEWKEGKTGDDGAFRVTLSAVAYNGTPLTWDVRWDNLAGPVSTRQEYWRKFNNTVPVPTGEWFKLEVFWHRSAGSDGRVWFAVNGQVIDDHYGPNIGVTNAPINRIFASQVYSGSVYPIYQWMDDMQVWQGWPTVSSTDAWYDPPYAPH